MPLYSAGSNSRGQLSHRDQLDAHSFQPCHFTNPATSSNLIVHDLALGANHTLALCSYASTCPSEEEEAARMELWGSGSNQRGQLGPGENGRRDEQELRTSFVRIPLEGLLANVEEEERQRHRIRTQPPRDEQDAEYDIISIACAWETSFVHLRRRSTPDENVASSDLILSFGANDWNERGIPSHTHFESAPVNIISFNESTSSVCRITQLVSGPRHVLAIVKDSSTGSSQSRVFGWGASRHGQLGRGGGIGSVGGSTTQLPRTFERPYKVQLSDPSDDRPIGSTRRPVGLAVGRDHSIILFEDESPQASQSVVLFGSNKQKQLHVSNIPSVGENPTWVYPLDKEVTNICATWTSSFFPFKDGTVQSFGSNTKGQLGRPDPSSSDKEATSFFVKFPTPNVPPQKVDITSLATGSEHILAIDRHTGDVYGWGWNEHGNLGLSRTEDVGLPEVVWSAQDRGEVGKVWCGNATSFVFVAKDQS
ncbi:BZ3500_MvSof-1268-A1-R1_Chr7-1g09298 [Microbotryum saponariae]|uniref:BZ3500_MvSof-1268-A1-R1_Chr7-1g09298 protein n=1 Tax=Microbotryum saponariae TaxID=289078 RepID=A0A2X0LV56_9BASI|nr:BZ3501_MvSof-1269-A2-R1_Chr7-1g09003 [Microbotryum saponariae]SDA03183.1 BZ3500_MvSof-1268-A1-R1_Chr7-1g09298 [Microbotryum saponariae]